MTAGARQILALRDDVIAAPRASHNVSIAPLRIGFSPFVDRALLQLVCGAHILHQSAPDEREFIRVGLQEDILKGGRANNSDPDSQWLVSVYDDVHRPIAPGAPPLTESMVSHYTTFVAWLFEIPLTQQFKDAQRAMLIRDWKNPKEIDSDIGPSIQSADPSTAAGLAALERSTKFTGRTAATLSEEELPAAAKDVDPVVQLYRRPGPNQNPALAAQWDDTARAMRAGKAVYQARQENADRLLIMKAQFRAQQAINGARAISNMYVFGDAAMANVITNINNSPYQTVVVPVVPR